MEEVKGVRYHKFKDEKIYALLIKKNKLVVELRAMQAGIDKIAKEGEVLGNKIQKVKDRVIPMMDAYIKKVHLNEWEIVTTMDIDGDEISLTTVNSVSQSQSSFGFPDPAGPYQKEDADWLSGILEPSPRGLQPLTNGLQSMGLP